MRSSCAGPTTRNSRRSSSPGWRGLAAVLALSLLWLPVSAASADSPDPAPEAAKPEATCAERVALKVQRHYEGVKDLQARFSQTTRSVMLGSGLGGEDETTGSVVFAKPGRMRWEYETPEPSLVVSDGSTLWLHDPVAREVQRLPVSQGYLSGAALQFLLGEGNLLESFRVEADPCGPELDRVELRLTPREAATYERMGLTVSAESGAVRATEVVDLFGNVTRIAFDDVRTNQDVAGSVFVFVPPKGTRVIDLAPR